MTGKVAARTSCFFRHWKRFKYLSTPREREGGRERETRFLGNVTYSALVIFVAIRNGFERREKRKEEITGRLEGGGLSPLARSLSFAIRSNSSNAKHGRNRRRNEAGVTLSDYVFSLLTAIFPLTPVFAQIVTAWPSSMAPRYRKNLRYAFNFG